MSFNLIGTGMYVPEKIVTNRELSLLVDTSDEWISQRVGVLERHVCTTETAADLGYKAAINALKNCNCKPEDLNLIIAATVSCETVSPSLACMIQKKLGATCTAYDINAACSGFLFLLETAAGYYARKKVNKVLIVGAERMSRILDWDDRDTCCIFGDGAGAAILSTGENYLDSTFTVKGGDDIINIPQFSGKSPFYEGETQEPYIQMNGQETFKFAVNAICDDITLLMERNNLKENDITYVIAHQANKRIIDYAARRLKFDDEKFYMNIERYGNTSSASIPIALDELNRQGKIKKGDLLILTAFGGGLANASCLLKW